MEIRLDDYNLMYTHDKEFHPNVKTGENEMQEECKTYMTSVTIAINSLDEEPEELTKTCMDLHDKYNEIIAFNKSNYTECWNSLGYCGVNFLDWLTAANTIVMEKCESISDPIHVSYIKKGYIKGINIVYGLLFTK